MAHSAILSYAQNKAYQVLRANTKEPIPYVTVKIKHSNLGFHTNENGFFSFNSQTKDTLILTAVGFYSKELCLSHKVETHIFLEEAVIDLKEVKIKPHSSSVIGIANAKNALKIGSSINFEYAVMQKILQGSASCIIEKIYIKANKLQGKCPIKLHIYSIENDKPDKELLTKNIFVNEFPEAKKIVTIDISSQNIVVYGTFFIALEWVGMNNCNNKGGLIWATDEINESLTYKRTFLDPKYEWNKIDNKAIETIMSSKTGNPLNLQIYSQIIHD